MKKFHFIFTLTACFIVFSCVDRTKFAKHVSIKERELSGISNDYIPKDIIESIAILNNELPFYIKRKIKTGDAVMFHHSLGRNLRNRWGLWRGSRLAVYFGSFGIRHPDDMSGIILESYHRYLNSEEIGLQEQVNRYKQYWKKMKDKYKKQ